MHQTFVLKADITVQQRLAQLENLPADPFSLRQTTRSASLQQPLNLAPDRAQIDANARVLARPIADAMLLAEYLPDVEVQPLLERRRAPAARHHRFDVLQQIRKIFAPPDLIDLVTA
jgi:hypothetical protein